MVIITHWDWSDTERLNPLFLYLIDMAVPVFMMISGFVNAMSFDNHGIISLNDAYNSITLIRHELRFVFPFLIAFFIEIIGEVFRHIYLFNDLSVKIITKLILLGILQGGFGPGSYYVPVMCQFVFVFPLLWLLMRNGNHRKGLVIAFFLNLVFEIFKSAWFMGDEYYRLVLYRYIFAITFGMYFYYENYEVIYKSSEQKNNIKRYTYFRIIILILGFIIGIAYIYLTKYNSWKFIIFPYWSGTSMISILYIAPIFSLLLKCSLGIKLDSNFFLLSGLYKTVKMVGKSSYNIFLTQMVFYTYFPYKKLILKKICYENLPLALIVNVVICCGFGVLFYSLMQPFIKWADKTFSIKVNEFCNTFIRLSKKIVFIE